MPLAAHELELAGVRYVHLEPMAFNYEGLQEFL